MIQTTFRDSGKGESIRFAVGECSPASILVVAAEHGVCTISLGNDPAPLVRELGGRFPTAELTEPALLEREAAV